MSFASFFSRRSQADLTLSRAWPYAIAHKFDEHPNTHWDFFKLRSTTGVHRRTLIDVTLAPRCGVVQKRAQSLIRCARLVSKSPRR